MCCLRVFNVSQYLQKLISVPFGINLWKWLPDYYLGCNSMLSQWTDTNKTLYIAAYILCGSCLNQWLPADWCTLIYLFVFMWLKCSKMLEFMLSSCSFLMKQTKTLRKVCCSQYIFILYGISTALTFNTALFTSFLSTALFFKSPLLHYLISVMVIFCCHSRIWQHNFKIKTLLFIRVTYNGRIKYLLCKQNHLQYVKG